MVFVSVSHGKNFDIAMRHRHKFVKSFLISQRMKHRKKVRETWKCIEIKLLRVYLKFYFFIRIQCDLFKLRRLCIVENDDDVWWIRDDVDAFIKLIDWNFLIGFSVVDVDGVICVAPQRHATRRVTFTLKTNRKTLEFSVFVLQNVFDSAQSIELGLRWGGKEATKKW